MKNKKLQVFVSSTYTDLIEERQTAVQAILDAGHIPAGMELFKAGKSQMKTIQKWIDESDVYMLILGGRYGSIEESSGLSYTELEYRYALSKNMPVFAIILEDSYLISKVVNCGRDAIFEKYNKYNDFMSFVKKQIVIFINDINQIAGKIHSNLNEIYNDTENDLIGWVRTDSIIKKYKIETIQDNGILRQSNVSRQLQEDGEANEILKNFLESWIKQDFHTEGRKKEIEVIYNYYKKICDKGNWTNTIIDIGYLLTDVFDRESEYDKSLEITKQILTYYELYGVEGDGVLNPKYIRKIIGCSYGLAIAKVKSDEQKAELLNQSEKLFKKAKELCENYSKNIANIYFEKEFLWGMYYSDHAAFLINKGDYNKKMQDVNNAEREYNLALEDCKTSIEHREKLLKVVNSADYATKHEVQDMMARVVCSMGVIFYRLNQFEESIKKHEEALRTFIVLDDKDREYRTKEYIIGSSIKLWKRDPNNVSFEKFNTCQNYLNELFSRFGNTDNLRNYKKVLKEIERNNENKFNLVQI